MLLFDLEDYIPLVGTCPTREQWEDIATTARETRNAYFKALTEWYRASTVCLTSSHPCYKEIKKQWDLIWSVIEPPNGKFYQIFDEFFNMMILENGQFSPEVCDKYRKFMVNFRCAIKRLMRLVDGDPFTKVQFTKSLYE